MAYSLLYVFHIIQYFPRFVTKCTSKILWIFGKIVTFKSNVQFKQFSEILFTMMQKNVIFTKFWLLSWASKNFRFNSTNRGLQPILHAMYFFVILYGFLGWIFFMKVTKQFPLREWKAINCKFCYWLPDCHA